MKGGDLSALWAPYELYGLVDKVYGPDAWASGYGFTSAQGMHNVVKNEAARRALTRLARSAHEHPREHPEHPLPRSVGAREPGRHPRRLPGGRYDVVEDGAVLAYRSGASPGSLGSEKEQTD